MTIGIRKTGEICWINMLTPQPAEAREFLHHVLWHRIWRSEAMTTVNEVFPSSAVEIAAARPS